MVLNLNPLLLNEDIRDDAKRDEWIKGKIFKLRQIMEDPAYKLEMDNDLRIVGDVKFKIIEMKESICKALIDEE